MTSVTDSANEQRRATLLKLDNEDRGLFAQEKESYLERRVADSPLLDELCCVRVVAKRLAEGYATALGDFDQKVDERTRMRVGWRKSATVKRPGEYESPMPWLHPFKLAGEELERLEAELEAAVLGGETRAASPSPLESVLAGHGLELPLPSADLGPAFPPGGVRTYESD